MIASDTGPLAQEIIVDIASYPTEKIARTSHDYRPLVLGFANLGALLMSMGIPYDSPAGRDWAGAITAGMWGQASLASARIPETRGACPGFRPTVESFPCVILTNGEAISNIYTTRAPPAPDPS